MARLAIRADVIFMLVLGIETSCDETAFGLVEDGVLCNASMASQADLHALFGGVVPELASREHYRMLGPLFDRFMADAGKKVSDLDAVAVTRGPGLLGSLLVGVAFAKALAYGAAVPLIGVDHLKAHLLAAGIEGELPLPALGLLVSGGHTHLYYIRSAREFTLLGRSLDDAAGEAFDKVAKVLTLPYPGGRYLDALARKGKINERLLPCPYLDNDNLNFSFSGLKTAAATLVSERPELKEAAAKIRAGGEGEPLAAEGELADFCASFNYSVARTLTVKTARALKKLQEDGQTLYSITAAGGVAANSMIRAHLTDLAHDAGLPLILPSPQLCTDNGAMIAYTGYLLAKEGLGHGLDMSAIPRGSHIPEDMRPVAYGV